jgi:serine/threonine protein kinase
MTHSEGGNALLSGLFTFLKTWREAPVGTREQVKDWRYHNEEEFIAEEDSAFIQRVLKIDPEERPSAAELLEDEWLKEI